MFNGVIETIPMLFLCYGDSKSIFVVDYVDRPAYTDLEEVEKLILRCLVWPYFFVGPLFR